MSYGSSQKRDANLISTRKNSRDAQLFHGHVFEPSSRAYIAWQKGLLDYGQLNQCEAGKFFPQAEAGLKDSYAPDDNPNSLPPADGKIASGNQPGMAFLDEPGSHWEKHDVRSFDRLDVKWDFTANHVTRRWNYFITKSDWNPNQLLSRSQFEDEPFYVVQFGQKPYWSHADSMKPPIPTMHALTLPEREGHHVLLAVWEVADTGNAFYQIVDLNFVTPEEGNTERPSTPTGFQITATTEKSVSMSWNANPPTDPYPVTTYRITRNGRTTVEVNAPALNWTDSGVTPGTTYTYSISAINSEGNISLPSLATEVTTPLQSGVEAPPGAPKSLHSMAITDNSVELMWGASTSENPVKLYHVYRDGVEVGATSSLNWLDSGLKAETGYQYFVAAENGQGWFSVPGNVIFINTKQAEAEGGGEGEGGSEGSTVDWAMNTPYTIGDRVKYSGKVYGCLQDHISNAAWNPEVTMNILWALEA